MIGKIILDKGENKWFVLDKIRRGDKDFYLVKNIKTNVITIIDPINILRVLNEESLDN